MNYRHLYHAGNFADVFKHVVLITLLHALKKKPTPFCFLDTHAGIGLYPLESIEAQKSREYENGVAKLFSVPADNAPEIIQKYIHIIKQLNSGKLQYYPGSPRIAEYGLRTQDQLILCELHSQDVITLKQSMPKQKNIAIHHTDGYLAMKAFLPPKQKRGLVLIDPPFEKSNEFELIAQSTKQALAHWRSGHFMIWYPIKNQKAVNSFYKNLRDFQKPLLIIECALKNPELEDKLSSCGIVLINPPWKIEELLNTKILPFLTTALNARFIIDSQGTATK